jgi:hypothetical protein
MSQQIAFDFDPSELLDDETISSWVTIDSAVKGERVFHPGKIYGHVKLRVDPYVGPTDYLLEWAVDEDVIPKEFMRDVKAGISRGALVPAEMGSFSVVVGLKVTVIGGCLHRDGRRLGYSIVAALALKNALGKAELVAIERA